MSDSNADWVVWRIDRHAEGDAVGRPLLAFRTERMALDVVDLLGDDTLIVEHRYADCGCPQMPTTDGVLYLHRDLCPEHVMVMG